MLPGAINKCNVKLMPASYDPILYLEESKNILCSADAKFSCNITRKYILTVFTDDDDDNLPFDAVGYPPTSIHDPPAAKTVILIRKGRKETNPLFYSHHLSLTE